MSHNLLNSPDLEILKLLDWDIVLNDILFFSHFEISKEKLKMPIRAKTSNEIESELDSLNYFIEDINQCSTLAMSKLGSIPTDKDSFNLIFKLKKGHILSLKNLNFICLVWESYISLTPSYKQWNKINIFHIKDDLIKQIRKQFVVKLRSFVDRDGEINYHQHPILSKIFQQIVQSEQELRSEIQKLSRSDLYSNSIQFKEHDIINDHYVLAIRSDSYKSDHGTIIARSDSGLTLYVCPPSIRSKSNQRLRLLAEFEEILSKIEREFCTFLRPFQKEFHLAQEFIIELDMLYSKSSYCRKLKLKRPSISKKFQIHIRDMFHPLIENPVTNDIEISGDKKGFILSGPNTGGKTVTLKSLALCHIFLHYGLYLPVSDATIYPVKNIYYFGNDQQDLSKGLSSFASESKNYLELLDNLNDDNLVIIDEIFNSTSSEEASALAISLLDEIHSKANTNAKIVISTHHQLFKTFIHSNSSYISAHVGYDEDETKPTYKILSGEPGPSMAFNIFNALAKKHKVKTQIPEHSKELLDKQHISYEKLLQELSSKRTSVDRLIRQNEDLNKELRNQKQAMKGLLLLDKQKMLQEYKEQINDILSDAEKLFLKTRDDEFSGKKSFYKQTSLIKQKIDDSEKEFNKDKISTEPKYQTIPDINNIRIGDSHYSAILNKTVKITGINKRRDEIEITHKKARLKCPISSLRIINNHDQNKKDHTRIKINIEKSFIGLIELDCRGMRLDEFQKKIELSLNELLAGEIPYLSIIHGHGDGILKGWLREFINQHHELKWKADDGNDGCTRISLHC